LFEWQAPTVDSTSQSLYHLAVFNPSTGTELLDWQAPTNENQCSC